MLNFAIKEKICDSKVSKILVLWEVIDGTHMAGTDRFRDFNSNHKNRTVSWKECLSPPSVLRNVIQGG